MTNPATPGGIPVFKTDPIMVVVLGFVTCGLYLIYWNMKAAEVLNAVAKKEIISQPLAIFCGCCHPVNGYFYYLAGEALADVGKLIGKEEELKGKSTLLLVLGIFLPAVAAMIVQGHINELYADNKA
jgi:hypothetical protein